MDIGALKVGCGHCSLAELCLPRGLSTDEVDRLDMLVKRRPPLQRGQTLFRAGDAFHALFAIRSGSLKTTALAGDGAEKILGFHLAGELVGLDAIHGDIHNCAAVALETTSLCEVPFPELGDLSRQVPGLQLQLFRLAGQEISHDQEMLLTLGNRNAEERLSTFLWTLGSRLGERGFSRLEFNLTMSRHDIANYLGLAVETISRLFTHMHKEGLLRVERRHITILDPERLHAMAHLCAENPARAAMVR